MTNICQYVCDNKTEYGYCRTTVCINPEYNQQTVKAWLSKADYVQVVRCGECRYSSQHAFGYGCKFGYHLSTDGSWYCGDGERREDDE